MTEPLLFPTLITLMLPETPKLEFEMPILILSESFYLFFVKKRLESLFDLPLLPWFHLTPC